MDRPIRGFGAIRDHLDRGDERPTVVTDSAKLIGHLVTVDPGALEVSILTRSSTLDAVIDVAYLRWTLQECIDRGASTVHHESVAHRVNVVVWTDQLLVILEDDGTVAGLLAHDRALIGAIGRCVDRRLDDATVHAPEGPPLRTVIDALDDHLGAAVRAAAIGALAAEWLARLEGRSPPAIEVVLLAAARWECLLGSVADWAAEVEVANRGEVSRAKDRLVDAGFVETTAEVEGEGRPPLRLHLDDTTPRRAPDEAYARLASRILEVE